MNHQRKLSGRIIALSALLFGLYGCAAEAQPSAHSSALQQGAAGGSADLDRDIDERTDEANDRDDDIDEANDRDSDVDEQTDEANEVDDEFDVQFAELPQAVRTAAEAEIGTGTVTGVDRDNEPTGLVYEIDFTRDGVRYEVDIDEDGTVLKNKRD